MPVSGKRQIQHGKMPKNAKCQLKKRQIIVTPVDFELFSGYLGLLQSICGKRIFFFFFFLAFYFFLQAHFLFKCAEKARKKGKSPKKIRKPDNT
jgi:hypothetical protein